MSRPRVMFDIRTLASPKLIGLPSDRHRICYFDLVFEAKQQAVEGVFASMAVVKYSAKHRRDCIPALIDGKLLHAAPAMCDRCLERFGEVDEKAVVVHDWQDYQEPVRSTVWRRTQRERNDDATPSATEMQQFTRAGALSRSLSLSNVVPPTEQTTAVVTPAQPSSGNDDRDALDTYYDLTRFRPWGQWSGDAIQGAINEYGDAAVDAAIRAEWAASADRETLLSRFQARLARDADREKRSKPRRSKPKVDEDEAYAARARAVRELMAETA